MFNREQPVAQLAGPSMTLNRLLLPPGTSEADIEKLKMAMHANPASE